MNHNRISGTVFRARDWPQGNTEIYVFVPDSYFDFNEEEGRDPGIIDFSTFDEETYRISRWPGLSAQANGLAVDGCLLPDLVNLLPDEDETSPGFARFRLALEFRVQEFFGDFHL